MAGLNEVVEITGGRAPPGSYRLHTPADGRRAPETGSLNLLTIIDREPEAAARALHDS